MTRKRLTVLSTIGGIALAAGVLIARPDVAPSAAAASGQRTVAASEAPRAIDAAALSVRPAGDDYEPFSKASGQPLDAAADAEIVDRATDPLGGPDWALRTFQRGAGGDDDSRWCAQLGRIVDGKFTWVQPGATIADELGLDVDTLTSCASTSPIAQRSSVQIATLPDRPLDEPGARPAATVVWGAIDGDPLSAQIKHDTASGPVEIHRHGFLKVLPGTDRASRTLLEIRDPGDETRAAVPLRFFDMEAVASQGLPGLPGTAKEQPKSTAASVTATYERTLPANAYVLAGSQQRPGDSPMGIFTERGARGPCATGEVPLLGERPAMSLSADRNGLVNEAPPGPCQSSDGRERNGPAFLGAGSSSGLDDRPGPGREMRRQRNELRRDYSSSSALIAVPEGTKLLEVRSPIGIKVVRVHAERVTFVSWDGQPDVAEALMPSLRRFRPGGLAKWRPERGISFRALDGEGRQVGELLRTNHPPTPKRP